MPPWHVCITQDANICDRGMYVLHKTLTDLQHEVCITFWKSLNCSTELNIFLSISFLGATFKNRRKTIILMDLKKPSKLEIVILE